MRSKLLIIFLALGVFHLIGVSKSSGSTTKAQHDFEGLRVTVPKDILVTKRDVGDWYSIVFKKGGQLILGAYVGNFPQFPSKDAPKNINIKESRINGNLAKSIVWTDAQGKLNREVLIRIKEGGGFPVFVHYGYSGTSKNNQHIANGIIKSTISR